MTEAEWSAEIRRLKGATPSQGKPDEGGTEGSKKKTKTGQQIPNRSACCHPADGPPHPVIFITTIHTCIHHSMYIFIYIYYKLSNHHSIYIYRCNVYIAVYSFYHYCTPAFHSIIFIFYISFYCVIFYSLYILLCPYILNFCTILYFMSCVLFLRVLCLLLYLLFERCWRSLRIQNFIANNCFTVIVVHITIKNLN